MVSETGQFLEAPAQLRGLGPGPGKRLSGDRRPVAGWFGRDANALPGLRLLGGGSIWRRDLCIFPSKHLRICDPAAHHEGTCLEGSGAGVG